MSNYAIVLVALSCQILANGAPQTDTILGTLQPFVNKNTTNTGSGIDDKSHLPQSTAPVSMHGHHNYNAAQQIFYNCGAQQPTLQQSCQQKSVDRKENGYEIGKGTHKFHSRKVTWNQARRICVNEGGHLAIVNTKSEEQILIQTLTEHNVGDAWLGVHDLYEEGDWVTVLDQSIESAGYARWSPLIPSDPDNYNGKQHCGMLLKTGGMDDIECTSHHSFFCEISA